MKKHIAKREAPRFDAEGYQINMRGLGDEALPDPGKLKFRPFSHGGARRGAGRKSSGRKPVLLRLSPAVVKRLRARAKAERRSLSEVVEERLAVV